VRAARGEFLAIDSPIPVRRRYDRDVASDVEWIFQSVKTSRDARRNETADFTDYADQRVRKKDGNSPSLNAGLNLRNPRNRV